MDYKLLRGLGTSILSAEEKGLVIRTLAFLQRIRMNWMKCGKKIRILIRRYKTAPRSMKKNKIFKKLICIILVRFMMIFCSALIYKNNNKILLYKAINKIFLFKINNKTIPPQRHIPIYYNV